MRWGREPATVGRLDAEAEGLIKELGVGAYSEARRREREASSDAVARDWSVVAAKVAQLAGGLIDGADAPAGAWPSGPASNGGEGPSPARTQPFRIQFIRLSPNRQSSVLDEVLIQASDASAAIIAAACAPWPPLTRELRILDRTGHQVFERKADGRRNLHRPSPPDL